MAKSKSAKKSKPVKKVVAKKAAKAASKSATKKAVKKVAKPSAKSTKNKTTVKAVVKKSAKAKAVSKKAKSASQSTKAAIQKVKSTPVTKPLVDLSQIFTPLDDRLIVQLTEAERRTAGGLYIPDTVSDVSGNVRGRVVSVGRGRRDKKGRLHPMDVNPGDQVIFPQYAGSKIQLMGHELVILKESEVMGVVG